jgi:hypothetical protein
MKITTEMPDELYRRVKAKAAREGLAVREVTEQLYRAWLSGGTAPGEPPASLTEWLRDAAELMKNAPPTTQSASEIISAGRRRLGD